MFKKFETYYKENQLFEKSNQILLAVSGGVDSVFMVHLFLKEKINFGIAHCNFKLRGEEADLDECFVEKLAEQHNIPFYKIDFDTEIYAKEKGVSIQMAARELRYIWFEKIRKENKYDFIATAHHKNDVAETMLINLTKRTGIAGLHGIKSKKNKIIRPILCFNRKEIEIFIEQNKIEIREDKSNSDIKYVRNNIRHKVIPQLETINPNFINSINDTAAYLKEIETVLLAKIKEDLKNCVQVDPIKTYIDINALKQFEPLSIYLYYFLKSYNFNADQIKDIILALNSQSGKLFYSSTHQLVKDRECFIIIKKQENFKNEVIINSYDDLINITLWDIKRYVNDNSFKIRKSQNYANIDADKLKFPLKIRDWNDGDSFKPLGMKGRKKISDYFIDKKIDVLTKHQTQLLVSGNEIIWVVGHRISNNYKITKSTKNIIVFNSSPILK